MSYLLTPADIHSAFQYVVLRGGRLHVFSDDLKSGDPAAYLQYRLEVGMWSNGTTTFASERYMVSRASLANSAKAAKALKGGPMWELANLGIFGVSTSGAKIGKVDVVEFSPAYKRWAYCRFPEQPAFARWLLDTLIPHWDR